jgi:hypothetical protein
MNSRDLFERLFGWKIDGMSDSEVLKTGTDEQVIRLLVYHIEHPEIISDAFRDPERVARYQKAADSLVSEERFQHIRSLSKIAYERASPFSTETLAKFLCVSPRTVRDWRNRKVGPTWSKVGGRYRYSRVDVCEWLAALRQCEQERRVDPANASPSASTKD